MKVISIGTDRKIFEENSQVRARALEYGKLFEEIHIVVFNLDSKGRFSFSRTGQNVLIYPTNSKNKFSYIFDAFKIGRRIVSDNNGDFIISCQDPFETGLVGLMLKFFCKLPLQIQIHTDFMNRYFITHNFLNLLRLPISIFVLSFADSARVVSQKIADSIKVISHNISVLPVYTEIRDTRYEIRKHTESVNFLTVCRLEKEKNLETAIRAFKVVLINGIKSKFVIVGEGSEMQNLVKLSESLGIKENIFFAGWRDNLEDFYSSSDIYVSTSLYEGYGMSVVEAALHGLPLILSDTGVAGSVFKNNISALISKPKDVSSFSEAMLRLASSKNLAREIGQRAKTDAEHSIIDWTEYLNRYQNSIIKAKNFYHSENGIFKKNILLRYFVAGITGASTQIGLLFVFTDVVNLWYLYSSVIAFCVAVLVSFVLQKFWTFRDGETNKIHHQFARFFVVAVSGLILNTALMYFFVDLMGIWYILAQIIIGAIIMVFNFLMYKFFIFHKK